MGQRRATAAKPASLGKKLRAWLTGTKAQSRPKVLDYRSGQGQASSQDFPVPPSLTEWSTARIATVQDVFGTGHHGPADTVALDDFVAPLGIRASNLVAELGPGLGALSRRMARAKCHIVAYEPNPALAGMWRQAMMREKLEQWQLNQVDLNDLSFPDYKFDYMISKEGMLGVSNKPLLLDKMRKAIKLGGKIMLSDYVRGDGGSNKTYTQWRHKEPQAVYPMTLRQWETALTDANFEITEVIDITAQVRRDTLQCFERYSRSIKDMARNMETGRLDWALAEGEHWALRLGVFDEGAIGVKRFLCRASESLTG